VIYYLNMAVTRALIDTCLTDVCAGTKGEMVVGWATLSKSGTKVQYTCSGCGQYVVEGKASYYYMPWLPIYVSPQIHCTLEPERIACLGIPHLTPLIYVTLMHSRHSAPPERFNCVRLSLYVAK
jgi:hypothetical protein